MHNTAVLSSAYLAPVQYFQKLTQFPNVVIDQHEHFVKQTYRSRCHIYSPNGLQMLSIPLIKRDHRQTVKDVKICNDYNWQNLHWKSIQAGYRRSAYFEFYEDDFRPFYEEKKFTFLTDLNDTLLQTIIPLLKIKANYTFSDEYISATEHTNDYRNVITPKGNFTADRNFRPKPYWQVFENKHGFIENLSIVDLLFNQGPRANEFI